jgi:hypothetical protein
MTLDLEKEARELLARLDRAWFGPECSKPVDAAPDPMRHGIAIDVLRSVAERVWQHEDCTPETCACYRRGLESVISIRCAKHYAVSPYNRNEIMGSECAACAVERAGREALEETVQEITILRAALVLEHGPAHGRPDPSTWDKTDCDVCAILKFPRALAEKEEK